MPPKVQLLIRLPTAAGDIVAQKFQISPIKFRVGTRYCVGIDD